MKINIGYFLYKRALLSPKKEALVVGDVRYDYRQLNARANKLAHAMAGMGVRPGDRVAVLALNDPEYFELYFGLGKIGAVLVPINHRLAAPEVAYIAQDCGASVLVFGPEFAPVVEAVRKEIPAKTLLALGDTSPDWAQKYADAVDPAPDHEPSTRAATTTP